jgi:hypothetical protein
MVMECNLLDDFPSCRPMINRLKKDHPELYALNAAFFDEVLRTKELQKLFIKRYKMLSEAGRLRNDDGSKGGEEFMAMFAPVQTVRREAPKVGRNDPCPCGRGKKYKCCCGIEQ